AGFIGSAGRVDLSSTSGDVYVADTGRNRIYRFYSTGAFVSQITGFDLSGFWSGIAVDNSGTASDGDLVVSEENGDVSVYDNTDAPLFTIDPSTVPGGSLGDNCGVAVGPDGSIYLSDSTNQLINKSDSAGNFVTQITGLGFSPCAIDVAPDGTIYASETFVAVHHLQSDGTPISTFEPGQFTTSIRVDETT